MPNTLWPKSSISPAMARSIPCTRAIPSPTEMTLPTSATSTSTAKLPICSRMTLEISSALMFIAVDELSGPARELLSDSFELPPQAAIVDDAANPGDDAAEDLGLNSRRHHDLPPGQGAKSLPECSQAVIIQRHGGRHLGANDLAVIQEPSPILLEHLPRQRQAIAFGEQLQELPDHRLEAHLRGQGCHQRPLSSHRDRRVQQDLLELALLAEERNERGEVPVDLLEVGLLQADIEQPHAVAPGGRPGCHGRTPPSPPGRASRLLPPATSDTWERYRSIRRVWSCSLMVRRMRSAAIVTSRSTAWVVRSRSATRSLMSISRRACSSSRRRSASATSRIRARSAATSDLPFSLSASSSEGSARIRRSMPAIRSAASCRMRAALTSSLLICVLRASRNALKGDRRK